ncbi:MAG: hypothetical protein NTZ55_04440 [Candidatus Roizmanbacteria bacterium]|nr:hypothetical protein [Candidatus Roizmanbacteria bacterium]
MDDNLQKIQEKYGMVLRMIKEKKFTTIKTVSEILGIRYQTLQLWMKTKKVQKAIAEEVDVYLNNMKEAGKKDWKMWDRMIQYTKGESREEEKSSVTIQILNDKSGVGVQIMNS